MLNFKLLRIPYWHKNRTLAGLLFCLLLVSSCTYPPKVHRQFQCLNKSHSSYPYQGTRQIGYQSTEVLRLPIIGPLATGVMWVMLPFIALWETLSLPADLVMESKYQLECSSWLNDIDKTCLEWREEALRVWSPDALKKNDPFDTSPSCAHLRRSVRSAVRRS